MVNELNNMMDSYDSFIKTIKNPVLIALNTCPGLPEYAQEIIDTILDKKEIIDLLIQLKEHDEYTYKHSINVAVLSFFLAFRIGYDKEQLTDLTIGALLHDVGKSKIPLNVLNKPGKLTPDEFDIIRTHSVAGYKMVENLDLPTESKNIILYHHTRLDGSGYPKITDSSILTGSIQIVSLCDVFDALTGDRVYKPGMTKASAYRIINSEMSNQLNLRYLDALLDSFSIFDVGDIAFTSKGEKCKIIALNTENLNRPIIEILEGTNIGTIIDLNVDRNINLRYT